MRHLLLVPVIAVSVWLFGPTAAYGETLVGAPVNLDGRQFLEYDTHGDGRAVEVIGDLDSAQRIAIVVPGVDTNLADFDAGLGGVRRRAPAFQARQLYAELRTVAPDVPVAVVAWLGYDPPEGVGVAAVREDRAAVGASALESFVDSLTSIYPEARITLVGHSYGSVVAGLAAPHLGPAVTSIVVVGSPGLGVGGLAGLHTTAHVYAGLAEHDWVRSVPGIRVFGAGHGTKPSDPSFGASPLPVDGVDGHDGYFVSGTGSLRAMAEITIDEGDAR
jgi:pimeloyl-ACP methyl ester carboxylesterase